MNAILKFIEEHPTLIAICLPLLAGIGFLIKRKFFPEKESRAPFIKSGRDILAGGDIIVGNKTINQSQVETDKNIETFKNLVENASWRKELIKHKEVWICDKDNTFQIEVGEPDGEFREKWTQVYPDTQNVSGYPVYLRINNTTIKELAFVSCGGGRIFVPLPELQSEGNQTVYIWKINSLQYKVCQIIGQYYIYQNIEGIARMSKIRII